MILIHFDITTVMHQRIYSPSDPEKNSRDFRLHSLLPADLQENRNAKTNKSFQNKRN